MTADRKRITAAVAAIGVQALFVAALLFGLRLDLPALVMPAMQVFEIAPPPPPIPIVPAKARSRRASGKAAPPHARARATPVVAPPVVIPPDVPPPLVAAPVANTGAQAEQGAALAGPGTGAGGQGDGTGSGGLGDGDGGGEIPLRRVRGRLSASDYPRGALAAGVSGTVYLRWTVGVDGRVHDCQVTRSSGSAELDETTCRLVTQRFRYIPTRDASGRKVPDTVIGEHHWETTPGPPAG